ncbi:GTPase-associated protein 1-related protein [Streptomyces canus]|uniref:GTPase-associated protein 1-related protein n=1 Tax=Streptomyces canus TaxID=58343 RepID=UPI0036A144F5
MLRQLHYTSAPPGPDGSGFRFTAASADTDPALLRLAEPLLGYEPPRDAPARPTEAELAAFPVAFGFSVLPDGTGVLSRTRYTGADYSGRYGNFHAHALLVWPGETLPGGMLPVAAWESPDWQAVPPADRTPPQLEALRPGDRLNRQRLTAFARRRAERLAPFLADVRQLVTEERVPSLIMVEKGAEEVALWVALACAALPARQAAALTFTTYTRRPYLADQRIVGVPADAEFGYATADLGHQFRVHHCLGGTSSTPRPDPWAAVAARVWLAGRPDLLAHSADEAPFDAEPLAARALYEGVALDASGRAEGARWARAHAREQNTEFWRRFVTTLLADDDDPDATGAGAWAADTRTGAGGAPTTGPPDAGTRLGGTPEGDDMASLLPELLDALAVRWPAEVTEPLARAVVYAVTEGRGRVPDGLGDALSPGVRAELAHALGPRLADRLADPAVSPERLLDLLRLSGLLNTGLGGHRPPPAPGVRLADHLLARAARPSDPPAGKGPTRTASGRAPDETTPDPTAAPAPPAPEDVATVLAHPGTEAVRAALLDRLNDVALSGDPGPVVPVLARLGGVLDVGDPGAYPHLRVVAAAGRRYGGAETGAQLMTRLTQDAGGPEAQDPSVLLTAFRLAWPAGSPTASDAMMLLLSIPSALLAASKLDEPLARAALRADPTDPEAPELARRLLREELRGNTLTDPRLRDALNLLIHAEDIRTGDVESGFTAYAVALRDRARPLEDTLERRLSRNLAARLLVGRPRTAPGRASVAGTLLTEELEQLVRSGDEALLATYEAEARSAVTADRVGRHPLQLAACFVAWNSFEGLHPAWDRVRLRLLDEFLRPTVRKLPDTALTEAETYLVEAGGSWAERWRRWYRPGLGRRWARRRGGAGGTVRPPRTWRDTDPGTVDARPEEEL